MSTKSTVVALHPDEVFTGADYVNDLSSPVKQSLAWPAHEEERFGEIVLLQNDQVAYIPWEGCPPVIVEATSLIELIRALKHCVDMQIIDLSDEELQTLFSRVFTSCYR